VDATAQTAATANATGESPNTNRATTPAARAAAAVTILAA